MASNLLEFSQSEMTLATHSAVPNSNGSVVEPVGHGMFNSTKECCLAFHCFQCHVLKFVLSLPFHCFHLGRLQHWSVVMNGTAVWKFSVSSRRSRLCLARSALPNSVQVNGQFFFCFPKLRIVRNFDVDSVARCTGDGAAPACARDPRLRCPAD